MWTTADGHVLGVPGFRLRKWAEARKRGCAKGCACEGCFVRAVSEIEGELGEIVGRARRVGTATGKRSGRRLPIFSAVRGRKRYRIVARPVTGNRHAIVAITPQLVEEPPPVVEEPAPSADEPPPDAADAPEAAQDGAEGEWMLEFDTPRERAYRPAKDYKEAQIAAARRYRGTIDLEWMPGFPRAVSSLTMKDLQRGVGYVYILEMPDGTPFYAGAIEPREEPIKRMGEYRRSTRVAELFVEKICKKKLADAIFARVARVKQSTLVKAAEDALIGALARAGKPIVNVLLASIPLKAEGGDLIVNNILPAGYPRNVAGVSGNVLRIPAGKFYELESELSA